MTAAPAAAPSLAGPVALEARDVVVRFGAVHALDGVSVRIEAGRCTALVGESGSGKTTLLRCFNRMAEPQAGAVLADGSPVSAFPVVALRRRFGYVPQHGGLLPHWTVQRNVALVPALSGRSDAAALAAGALELVGLPAPDFGSRYPHELSGGQRQRAAIARALAGEPAVLLMDEPFGALDAITRAEVQAAFAALRRRLRTTTLLVTHDLLEARLIADEVVVLRHGRIEQSGAFAELRDSPATPYVAELFARALPRVDA